MLLCAYVQKPSLNTHAGVTRGDIVLNIGLCLHLHPYMYFVYESSEGSGAAPEPSLRDKAIQDQNLLCMTTQ